MPPKQRVGSKVQVFHGTADKTAGGKTRKDIVRIRQPDGTFRYVFRSRHEAGKRLYRTNPTVKAALDAYKIQKRRTRSGTRSRRATRTTRSQNSTRTFF